MRRDGTAGRSRGGLDAGRAAETAGAGQEQALRGRRGGVASATGPGVRPGYRGSGAGLQGRGGMWRLSRTTGRPARALAALGARIVPDTPAAGSTPHWSMGRTPVRARRAGRGGRRAERRPSRAAAGRAGTGARIPLRNFPVHFSADAAGIGTTLLSATSGVELGPAFGGASRARHLASGAREISRARGRLGTQGRGHRRGPAGRAGTGRGPHTALQAPHRSGRRGNQAPRAGRTRAAAAAGQSVWSVIRAICRSAPSPVTRADPLAGPQQQQAASRSEGRRDRRQRDAVVQQHAAGAGLGAYVYAVACM